jgi:sulfate transporter 3
LFGFLSEFVWRSTWLIFDDLGMQEGVAVGRSFAAMKNERIDGNKEMVAFGLMNLIGSFTSCYITTGN